MRSYLQKRDILAKTQPSPKEFAFHVGFVIVATLLFTVIDINVHIPYVNPIIAECYESNTSEFCQERREFAGVEDPSDQIALGDVYWATLLSTVLTIGIAFGVLRIIMGFLAGAKISPFLFLIGVVWFWGIISLYYFGWLDFGYFVLRGEAVPETLPWLNDVGLFEYVAPLGNTHHVDAGDLYLLMFLGLIAFLGPWIFMLHHHRRGTLKKWNLV